MLECSFELNNRPMSVLKIGALSFPAFSGKDGYKNIHSLMCTPGFGAIPAGRYYIFDRQSGGLIGPIRDRLEEIFIRNRKSEWYALYAIDNHVDDDMTLCDGFERGNFRLHPKGPAGISEGCVTIEHLHDWVRIRAVLGNIPKQAVSGSSLKAYGVLTVK